MAVTVELSQLSDRGLLEFIAAKLIRIEKMADDIQASIDEQTTAITELTSVADGVVAFIQNWADQIAAQADDPAQVRANTEAMKASASKIAEAIAANTPADPNA